MSDSDESAIDHLVNEALDGREAVDAMDAPDGAPLIVVDDQEAITESDANEDSGDHDDLEAIKAERDGYLADSQRLAADFANYRKQSDKRVMDAAAAQSASLVRDLIPVLDACDSALVQDAESEAGPIRSALVSELEKNGLELLAPADGVGFDPELHEAVMHEAAPDDAQTDGPVVGEVFRPGYAWKGRVIRPAMVKVIG